MWFKRELKKAIRNAEMNLVTDAKLANIHWVIIDYIFTQAIYILQIRIIYSILIFYNLWG